MNPSYPSSRKGSSCFFVLIRLIRLIRGSWFLVFVVVCGFNIRGETGGHGGPHPTRAFGRRPHAPRPRRLQGVPVTSIVLYVVRDDVEWALLLRLLDSFLAASRHFLLHFPIIL